jgi:GT2 family glycosyltransferase
MIISAIYVSWRDTDILSRSLGRMREAAADDEELELIVVVNEAAGGATAAIEAAWPGARVITNAANRGFGPACNQGAAAASGEVLLFLNPDTLVEHRAIPEIRRAFAEHPQAVAIAPRLVDPERGAGRSQREFQLRRLPTLEADARELLLIDRAFPANPRHRRDRYLEEDRAEPFEVEQAAAAALAVRRATFETVGGFDDRYRPAYWEDVDLCLRLRAQGSIVYWPAARIGHVGGVSASALGSRRFRRMYYGNAIRYRSQHYSRAAALTYRGLLAVGMALRAMVTLITSGPGPGTSQVLRSYLDVAGMALRDPGGASR